jgi:phospho-N-acetylmuramoyl-pentapeptide-transferase
MSLTLVLALVDMALFPFLIVWLRRIRFTQVIRDEGPASHKSKAGTPTGGGLMLVLNIAGAVAAYLFVMGRLDRT